MMADPARELHNDLTKMIGEVGKMLVASREQASKQILELTISEIPRALARLARLSQWKFGLTIGLLAGLAGGAFVYAAERLLWHDNGIADMAQNLQCSIRPDGRRICWWFPTAAKSP